MVHVIYSIPAQNIHVVEQYELAYEREPRQQ